MCELNPRPVFVHCLVLGRWKTKIHTQLYRYHARNLGRECPGCMWCWLNGSVAPPPVCYR